MDYKEFRIRGKEVTDWVADYLTSIRTRRVIPDVEPGYMQQLIPESPPEDGENWEQIFNDFEHIVLPGVTHWQSPYNHAYFPALTSPISMLGEMLANSINCLGFTWASSPACTELEIITTDWAAKMLGLPECFLHSNQDNHGGGSIHTTASEATLVSLLAARRQAIEQCREKSHCSELTDSEINSRLVAYCSDQAHSSVEKAAIISIVTIRLLPSDEQLSLRGSTLREAIQQDLECGLVPFYVCATLGTTGACGFDNLRELGVVCRENSMWLHVDAAYAGSAFVCPEFRWLMRGIDLADSFVFNASKWLLVHFDCTLMWVKDSKKLHRTFNIDPLYLRHENAGKAIDFMHWQIPLSKRFRSLKLWFVMRSYGIRGLQQHIRKSISLAKLFEGFVRSNDIFEVPAKRYLGLVVFRLKGENFQTETLLRRLNATGLLHMVPASIKGQYIIRYTVTSPQTNPEDIERDWKIISQTAYALLNEVGNDQEKDSSIDEVVNSAILNGIGNGSSSVSASKKSRQVPLRNLCREFGMSLVLSHVTNNPTVVNGSFVAFSKSQEVAGEFARRVHRRLNADQSPLRPRVRLSTSLKQLSHDVWRDPFVHSSPQSQRIRSTQAIPIRWRNFSLDSKVEDMMNEVMLEEGADEDEFEDGFE